MSVWRERDYPALSFRSRGGRKRSSGGVGHRLAVETLERRDLLAAEIVDLAGAVQDDTGGRGPALADFRATATDFQTRTQGNRVTLDGLAYPNLAHDPESVGRKLLAAVDPDAEYHLLEVKFGLASSHARFVQTVDSIPVYGSAASVHLNAAGQVQTVHWDSYTDLASYKTLTPVISHDGAASIAMEANDLVTTIGSPKGDLVWYPTRGGGATLAWQTDVLSVSPSGDFHTIVDAMTGEVLHRENTAKYVTGSGDVFEPNPYQTQGTAVGMVDNNDATSATLDAQLVPVTLQRLDAGTGLLRGEWADLSTLNSPTLPDVDADEVSRVYQYDRDDPRFEQVVIYHAIDSIQAYIHSLGFDDDTGIPNGIRDFPTLANAHWDTADQSFYSTGDDAIHFGDGGVDDGEDADIIAHEYGHAIQHDQNASWGGGDMGAMGEGFGDYLAASFYAGVGDAAFQAANAPCVGEWDATSYSGTNPPCLRRVDGNKIYPDDLVGQVHADGEIWSRALWDIRAAIGATTTDQLVFEHHFALPAAATMPDAANAMLTADVNLNAGANQTAIRQAFIDRGILSAGPAGSVAFDASTYGAGDTLTITLSDTDLIGAGPINVTVTTDAGDSETVSLSEGVAAEFTGTIASAAGAVTAANGVLDVAAGDLVTVTYNDADDGTGSPAVVTDTASILNLQTLFYADFSDEIGDPSDEGFTVSGPANEWHLSTGRGFDPGHSSDDSFYFGSGEASFGGGSHNNDSDGTLLSPTLDLTSATVAELSFNHFLESEASYDFATVSVFVGGSETDVASSEDGSLPVATTGFESVVIDLTPFVGQSVQVAFRFTSDFSVTNEGWYVDDFRIRSDVDTLPTLPEVFVADFSDDLGNPFDEGFTLSGAANEWHLSTGRGGDAGHTADDSFYFGSGESASGGGAHADNADGTLTSPPIDLTTATAATLSFNHFLDAEEDFDFASVFVLHPGGPSLLARSSAELPTATVGFEKAEFDLTPFVGQTIQIAFEFTSDVSVFNEGWYVDDVIVSADGGAPPPGPPEFTGNWISQGPFGANHSSLENLSPGNSIGGATHTVLAHPTDPDILYVGTVNGGIWRTDNATDPLPIWVPQTDFMDSLSIGAMAFDPGDATGNTLVAATARYSSFGGVGGARGAVYRTTDGGATWTDAGSAGLAGENLSGIAVRGSTIVVTSSAAGGGIFRSTNGGASFSVINDADFSDNDNFHDLVEDPTESNRLYAANSSSLPGGIYRSDDFGANWSKITGPVINSEMNDLLVASNNVEMAVAPTTGRLYVAILLSSQPEAIYHSDDADTASPTWTRMDIPVLPQGVGMPIAGASNASPIVITSFGHGLTNPSRGVNFVVIDGVLGNTAANGFHRVNVIDANTFELTGTSGNGGYAGGGTWTKVAGPSPTPKDEPESGAQGRTHFSIVADPTDANILYLGGDRQDSPNLIGGSTISGSIFRGDASLPSNPNVAPSPQWDHLTHDLVDFDPSGGTANGSAPHADSREMTFDAAGNLVEVDDGGVYLRTNPRDNTGDWFSLVGNLAASEFHDVAYDSVSNTLIGGLQDNGTLFQPASGATFWDLLSSGDGGDVAVDDVSLAGTGRSIRYSSFQNLAVFRRSTWDAAGNLLSESFPAMTVISGSPFAPQFNTPIALNHVAPSRLLFGMSNGVYESTDQGETLSAVAPAINPTGTTSGNAIDYGGRSGGLDNPFVAYVGDVSGLVHVRTTSGGAFVASDPTPISSQPIVDVVMDPDRWQTAFAIDTNQVFTTDNSGSAWSEITGDLAAVGASGFRSLQYVPGLADAVIVGTNLGVFASITTSLGSWFRLGEDLPNVPVFDLDYDAADDVLVAGTMGRGVWTLNEVRNRLVATSDVATVSIDVSGNLVVEGGAGGETDDLVLQSDLANSQFIVSGIHQTLTSAIAGASGSGTDTLTVPFSAVTGTQIIVDTKDGQDRLTIDFDAGDFGKEIQYIGGSPTSGLGDSLRLRGGGVFTTALYTFTGSDSGAIDLTGNSTITYTGLEPIDTTIDAHDVVMSYTDAAETITVTPYGQRLDRIHVASSAAENVSFKIPTGSLTIDGGITGFNDITVLGAIDLAGASVAITGDDVLLDGAAFLTSGIGSISIAASHSILLDDNSRLITTAGDITLVANQGVTPATGDFNGIFLDRSEISTIDGDVLLQGRGGDEPGGNFNRGILLSDKARILSTGTGPDAGTITLIGRGGDAADSNRGVQFDSDGTRVISVDGDILIDGTGGGSGNFNQGVVFFEGLVESTGTGAEAATITIRGNGGAGANSNDGVLLLTTETIVRAAEGNISIEGQSQGVGEFNRGVRLNDGAVVTSIGSGPGAANVSVNGVGGSGSTGNRGIQISGSGGDIISLDGDVVVNGTGGASGTFNQGVILFSGHLGSTGSGDVIVTGTAAGTSGQGIFLQGGPVIDATDSGDVTLTATGIGGSSDLTISSTGGATLGDAAGTGQLAIVADVVNVDNAIAIRGVGTLAVRPRTASTSIGIGGASGTLNLSDLELSRLNDGFSQITIGDAVAGTGPVAVTTATFADPVRLVGGDVSVNQLNAATNAVDLIARTGVVSDTSTATDVTGSPVTLTGEVRPGTSPGILRLDGGLVLNDGGTLTLEIGGTTPGTAVNNHDQIEVTGGVTIGAGVALATVPFAGFTTSVGHTFVVIDNDGVDAVVGSFAGLPEGASIANFLGSGLSAVVSYVGGDGNDVELTVVATPAAPIVESVVLNGGSVQRSTLTEIVVTFDREVTAPAAAFEVSDAVSAIVSDSLIVNTTVVGGKTIATLTFGTGNLVQTRLNGLHSLLDGDYLLTIDATLVESVGGGPNMAADYVFGDEAADDFFRKYGEITGDGAVNLFDFVQFRGTYLKSDLDPGYIEPLDHDGNNTVNIFDFVQFRANYLT